MFTGTKIDEKNKKLEAERERTFQTSKKPWVFIVLGQLFGGAVC